MLYYHCCIPPHREKLIIEVGSRNEVLNLNSIELFEDRLKRIENYDQRVVDDFIKDKNTIDQILSEEADTENITKEAIKELYRVYAIKDEYEVARMHLESTSKNFR